MASITPACRLRGSIVRLPEDVSACGDVADGLHDEATTSGPELKTAIENFFLNGVIQSSHPILSSVNRA